MAYPIFTARVSAVICKNENSCYYVVWARSAQKTKKQESDLTNIHYIHQVDKPFSRPLTACTADCVHNRGGGWMGSSLFVRCNLDKDPDPDNPVGITKLAPNVGECDNYMEGNMLRRRST